MFTGIITAMGQVRAVTPLGGGQDMRLTIGAPAEFLASQGGTALGASIACSGCCLTAVEFGQDWFAVEVSAETLAHTALGGWAAGTAIRSRKSDWFSTASAKPVWVSMPSIRSAMTP